MTTPNPLATTSVERTRLAGELMTAFASDTGLLGEAPPRRYLWTDAFAVCNFLGLHREGREGALDLALRLVAEVHHVLGRHRPDDPRTGWLSGLGDDEGERHPTRGGLRIGKALPERGPREPYDPRLEWDRDGQYFHYLTKWMHALQRVSEETGEVTFHRFSRELAARAHAAFVYRPQQAGAPRMVWKMSVDLSRPLVPSMGHHDPLDALATYLELEHGAPESTGESRGRDLATEIAEAFAMCVGGRWATDDALGIGGLLGDLARLGAVLERDPRIGPLLRQLLAEVEVSLRAFAHTPSLALPAGQRLAFRELGLAIGLHAVATLPDVLALRDELAAAAAGLDRYRPLAAEIEGFWGDPRNRSEPSWRDHPDINAVMLATSLSPAGYLGGGPRHADALGPRAGISG